MDKIKSSVSAFVHTSASQQQHTYCESVRARIVNPMRARARDRFMYKFEIYELTCVHIQASRASKSIKCTRCT